MLLFTQVALFLSSDLKLITLIANTGARIISLRAASYLKS
jgi:hypothetical protein